MLASLPGTSLASRLGFGSRTQRSLRGQLLKKLVAPMTACRKDMALNSSIKPESRLAPRQIRTGWLQLTVGKAVCLIHKIVMSFSSFHALPKLLRRGSPFVFAIVVALFA